MSARARAHGTACAGAAASAATARSRRSRPEHGTDGEKGLLYVPSARRLARERPPTTAQREATTPRSMPSQRTAAVAAGKRECRKRECRFPSRQRRRRLLRAAVCAAFRGHSDTTRSSESDLRTRRDTAGFSTFVQGCSSSCTSLDSRNRPSARRRKSSGNWHTWGTQTNKQANVTHKQTSAAAQFRATAQRRLWPVD